MFLFSIWFSFLAVFRITLLPAPSFPLLPAFPPDMPAGKMLRTFPSKVKVSFVVGASQYRNIHPEDFKVVADYNDFGNTPSDKCTIYIKKAPKYIRHLRLSIDQVDYLIEENG
jgi:hypothetical protein